MRVAELVRTGSPLDAVPEEVLKAVLAVWWDMPEFNSTKLGEDMQKHLEDRVFHSDDAAERFLAGVLEPPIRAGKDHVSGLYRLPREARFKRIAASLALRWLKSLPQAKQPVRRELLQICLLEGSLVPLGELVRERLASSTPNSPAQRMWAAAAFILELADCQPTILALSQADKSFLWSIKDLVRPDVFESRSMALTVGQLEFIVGDFCAQWPVAEHPSSTWSGDDNPWDATDFINSCIERIGANPGPEASDALDRLAQSTTTNQYAERIRHVRAQQRRRRRDNDYSPPTFEQVKGTLSDGPPGTIDDLKALMMDTLEVLQDYTRNADTNGWEAFWIAEQPKIENTCRDRALDAMRLRVLSKSVDLLPESLMPEKNRTDILALHDGKGLPIEVKGQWHPDVWDASKTQLDDKYGRDWRAEGRGVYLVLWFGPVKGKMLPAHPDGLPVPKTPQELRQMLLARLGESERNRIDVFVLDVCKPSVKAKSAR